MTRYRLLFRSVATVLTGGLAVAGHAQPLTFNHIPAANAAAQISAKYGVAVQTGTLGRGPVTFTIDDADAPGARLQAINALANAAGADFTNAYVIRKAVDRNVRAAQIDSFSSLPSSQTAYPAGEFIAVVAGMDDATVQTGGDVGGTVTLSRPALTVAEAAAEIARQTNTHWETVYTLTPRRAGRLTGGTIIGRTPDGWPIIELAYIYFHDAQWNAHQQRLAAAARQQALADQQAAQQATALAQSPAQRTAASYAGSGIPFGPYGNPNQTTGAASGYGGGGTYNPADGPIIFGGPDYGNAPTDGTGN